MVGHERYSICEGFCGYFQIEINLIEVNKNDEVRESIDATHGNVILNPWSHFHSYRIGYHDEASLPRAGPGESHSMF